MDVAVGFIAIILMWAVFFWILIKGAIWFVHETSKAWHSGKK